MSLDSGQVIVPLPAPRGSLPAATHVRSTLLLSSQQTLRAHDLYDRYVERLAPEHRGAILDAVAGVWLPMEVGMAHYAACEALALRAEEQSALGREVNQRVQGSFLGLLARTARGAGVTPWTIMGGLGRLWGRVIDGGGGVEVTRTGPKDARVELVGLPLLGVPYFRHAFRGVFHGGLEPLCRKAYVYERSEEGTETSAVFRVAWV